MGKEIQQVHIVGMGALGLLYGSMIAEHLGAEHVSYVMDGARYERRREDVYQINGKQVQLPICKAENAAPCDLLIVAVKFTDLDGALETMRTSVGEDTIIISVMNGISTEGIIGERYGMDRVIPTVAQGMDAMRFGKELTFTKSGQLHVGIDDPAKGDKLKRLTEFFDRAGIAYVVEKDIRYRIWSKFMINVGLNQTCMVCGANYAGVTAPNSLPYMIMVSAMREVMLVARAEGVNLTEEDLKYYLSLLKTFSPSATPSMGQDRINRRPSEVELFAGTVIRLAQKHGILVPTNEFLYRRVHEIEAGYGEEPCEPASPLQRATTSAIEKVIKDVSEKYPALYTSFHFGAIDLAPQHLVVCFIFKSDHELNQAVRNGTCESIERYWKESMLKNGWPEEAFSVKKLGHTATCVFASQETCDREFNGNWWHYFK